MRLKQAHRRNRNQQGYVLLAILFALTLLVLALAVAAPHAATMGQRAKENELIRRGEQYALGIRRFYKKFGRYPSSVDQLENTNNIRFLRRKYLDPLSGKDDWAPIQFGQARPALGFFGQKVVNTGGLSPSGVGLGPSTIGTGLGGASGTGSATSTSGSSSDSSGSATGGTSNTPTGTPGTNSGTSGPSGPAGSANNPFSGDQLSGKTFGGGAIVGVSVPSQKESLKEFQQKNHYNEWQFVYDPTMDPTLRGGASAGAASGIPGATGIGSGAPLQNPGGLNPASPNTNPQTPPGPTGTTTPPGPQ